MATLIFAHPAAKKQAEITLGNAMDNLHDMGREDGDEYAQDLGYRGRDDMTTALGGMLTALEADGQFTVTDDMARWVLESMEAEAPIFEDEHGPDGLAAIAHECQENTQRNQLIPDESLTPEQRAWRKMQRQMPPPPPQEED